MHPGGWDGSALDRVVVTRCLGPLERMVEKLCPDDVHPNRVELQRVDELVDAETRMLGAGGARGAQGLGEPQGRAGPTGSYAGA